jgi:hypothetical protein
MKIRNKKYEQTAQTIDINEKKVQKRLIQQTLTTAKNEEVLDPIENQEKAMHPRANEIISNWFEAAAKSDWEQWKTFLSSDAEIIQHIGAGVNFTPDEMQEWGKGLTALGISVRYENQRRTACNHIVVEQHLVVMSNASRQVVSAEACVLITISDNGYITRAEEYLDSNVFLPLFLDSPS